MKAKKGIGVCAVNERGVALMIVLWVLTLLSVIVGEFCYAMRTEVNITRNFKEETEMHYIAKAGVYRAVSELVKGVVLSPGAAGATGGEEAVPIWRTNADIPPVPFANGRYEVRIDNESGRINLNSATPQLLRMALNGFDLEDAEIDIIVDSIQDWRDADDDHRIHGAENAYYQSLERPYRCKNADFDAVEELLLVRGVTPEIFYGGLKDRVTTYGSASEVRTSRNWRMLRGRSDRVDINAAPPEVLLSLPMMTWELVLAVVDFRKTSDIRSVTDLVDLVGMDVYTAMQSYITFSGGSFYRVRSTGMPEEGPARTTVEALVEISGRYDKGYRMIEWKEGVDAFDVPQGSPAEEGGR